MAGKHDKHASRYTSDRNIPGAFEDETVTRRRFMTGTAHTAGAIAAASFTLPALGFAIGPIFKEEPHYWETVGTTDLFSEDNYVPVVVTITRGVGQAGKTTVYIRKHNPKLDTDPADRNTPYIAISTVSYARAMAASTTRWASRWAALRCGRWTAFRRGWWVTRCSCTRRASRSTAP
jgi:hypothetical protein